MEIEYWKKDSRKSPVKEFMQSIDNPKDINKILKKIDNLEEFGLLEMIKSGDIEPLSGYSLHELKIRYRKIRYRIFFIIHNNIAYLLHIFKKKSQKTPQKEINIALTRAQAIN